MKLVIALLAFGLLAACQAPAWTSFETKHPKPSLFQNPLPASGYQAPLPPL